MKSKGKILLLWFLLFATSNLVSTPDPTVVLRDKHNYAEVIRFLANDQTDIAKFDLADHNCMDFTRNLYANAKKAGLEAWPIIVIFKDETAHIFLAFETIDKGVVWIEPSDDMRYQKVGAGKYLCYYDKRCWPLAIIAVIKPGGSYVR